MKKIVIIPTYNEAENIEKTIKDIFKSTEDVEVLVVDDNSPDKTYKIVEDIKKHNPKLHIIKKSYKQGLGSAYITGFKWAIDNNFNTICEMDADGSHNPKHLNKFIEETENGFDVIIGSRRVKGGKIIGWNVFRHVASFMAMKFSKIFLNLKTNDITSGYRCYNTKIFKKINLQKIKSNGYAFQEEMIYLCEKNNFKIKEIPIEFTDREKGQSKLSTKDIIEFFIVMIKLKISEFVEK